MNILRSLASLLVKLACMLMVLTPATVLASDHADPVDPLMFRPQEPGITGLFMFPSGERMELVLTVRRGLTKSGPYDLSPYTYTINFDLHSEVTRDNPQDVARYGGTVSKPGKIASDASITLTLKDDASLNDSKVLGLRNAADVKVTAGVYDDPFIFPNFFGTNVIAMVVSIPMDAFPPNQDTWLVWATSNEEGTQLDHVGRAQRTMLPRFDSLNTLHPSEHVAALKERHESPGVVDDLARFILSPLFALRQYDFAPDVMIYTNKAPAGYPNGRRLSDDVADLGCRYGDCLLYELSFSNDKSWPRKSDNDKTFETSFPWLAGPWPDRAPNPDPELTPRTKAILIIGVLLVLGFIALPWILLFKRRD
ncbi:MAG: hypothetical protein ACPGUC_05075 [Gammaproteobacteria bacterium]